MSIGQLATPEYYNVTDIFNPETFADWLRENMDQFRYHTKLEFYFRRKNFNYPTSFLVREDKTGYHGIVHIDLEESSFNNFMETIKSTPGYVFADAAGETIYLWLAAKFNDADLKLANNLTTNPTFKTRVHALQITIFSIDDSLPALYFETIM